MGVVGSTQYFHPSVANPFMILFPGQIPRRLLKYVPIFPFAYCPVGAVDGYPDGTDGEVMAGQV